MFPFLAVAFIFRSGGSSKLGRTSLLIAKTREKSDYFLPVQLEGRARHGWHRFRKAGAVGCWAAGLRKPGHPRQQHTPRASNAKGNQQSLTHKGRFMAHKDPFSSFVLCGLCGLLFKCSEHGTMRWSFLNRRQQREQRRERECNGPPFPPLTPVQKSNAVRFRIPNSEQSSFGI